MSGLKDAVTLIATPEYAFPGCEGASHRSFIVRAARDPRRALSEFRGATAALNAHDSNTGMNLFRAAIAPIARGAPFFRATSSPARTKRAWPRSPTASRISPRSTASASRSLKRGRPELVERVAIVAESPLSPGLPFIAAAGLPQTTIAAVREALFAALEDPDLAEARAALGLTGARVATPADYDRVIEIERDATAAGYARLA